MSDAVAKSERSKAKDSRQMSAPDEVRRHRRKKKKPFVVESRYTGPFAMFRNGWRSYGKYATLDVAEKVVKEEQKKLSDRYELRLRK